MYLPDDAGMLKHTDALQRRAVALASGGSYEDCAALERDLLIEGYAEASKFLSDPLIRRQLDLACKRAWNA